MSQVEGIERLKICSKCSHRPTAGACRLRYDEQWDELAVVLKIGPTVTIEESNEILRKSKIECPDFVIPKTCPYALEHLLIEGLRSP